MREKEPDLAFQGILHSVFQRLESGEGVAIAFTSANSGEGVSYVSNKIASQLSASSSGSALHLSSTELCGGNWPGGPGGPKVPKWLDGFATDKEMARPSTAWEDWRGKVAKPTLALPLLDHRLSGDLDQRRRLEPGPTSGRYRSCRGGKRYPQSTDCERGAANPDGERQDSRIRVEQAPVRGA